MSENRDTHHRFCAAKDGDQCDCGLERERMHAVVVAARKLKAARDERHTRVRRLQELAAEARRTGKPGRVDEQPHAFDIGDVTDEICAAIEKLDATGARP